MKYLLLPIALLAGCATPQQQAMYHQQQAVQYQEQLTQACESYGFKPEAMAECRMKLDMINRAYPAPTLGQSIGRGLRAGGKVMQSPPAPPPTTCNMQTYPGMGTQIRCY